MIRKYFIFFLGIFFILLGIYLKEYQIIYNYAKKICFSCIGLG